jgi:hypothetical protein
MSATGQNPPKREIGSGVSNSARVYWPGSGVPGWSAFTADEHVPELLGSNEIPTYDQMLTNPQLWALFVGLLLPCMEYDVGIEAGDADPAMTEVLAGDLGLPIGLPAAGDTAPPIGPGTFNFNFPEHMWEALFALAYGRYYFEQVGEVIPDDGLWHLRRLAPRPPHDIADILTDDDGGLRAIMFPGIDVRPGGFRLARDVPIPVSQLVGYVWMPTARRRWIGRSMLRPCYEPWILRGRAVRIDIINHEKAGGIPFVETDDTWQGSSLTELRDLASEMNVSQESGAALPPGAHLKLARVGGTDVIASVRYHDEAMARAWGEMVRQLGQTQTGSRALGGTMADLEAVMRRAVMRWFASAFRRYVIRDWWDWNVGPTPHPSLAWRPRDDGQVPGDPGADPPNPPLARSASALAGRRGDARHRDKDGHRLRARAAVMATGRLPDRPLRRQPYAHEAAAAVDYAAMDLAYETGVDATERLLSDVWLPQLHQAAEDAVTFTKGGTVRKRLTRLDAARVRLAAPDPAPLEAILLDAAREGAAQATAELAGQGVSIVGPSDDELMAVVRDHAAAVAQQMADGVSIAASRRAIQVNAGRTPGEVASEVSDYLRGLAHQWERRIIAGAITTATNMARLVAFARLPAEQPVSLISSELLDAVCCSPCRAIDGYEFADWAEASRFYPAGYVDCEGGESCRGTVIAVLPES